MGVVFFPGTKWEGGRDLWIDSFLWGNVCICTRLVT